MREGRWIDGRRDGWIGRKDGLKKRQKEEGWKDERTDERLKWRKEERRKGWANEQINAKMSGSWGWRDSRTGNSCLQHLLMASYVPG